MSLTEKTPIFGYCRHVVQAVSTLISILVWIINWELVFQEWNFCPLTKIQGKVAVKKSGSKLSVM